MKNWKTTLGGVLLALGAPLVAAGDGWVSMVGTGMLAIGGLLTGVSARDSDVTDEESGAVAAASKRRIALASRRNRFLPVVLACALVAGGLAGCQTTVTRSADGTVTVRAHMDEDAAVVFAERMLNEAVRAYELYRTQENAHAEEQRDRWRREMEHWLTVLSELQRLRGKD